MTGMACARTSPDEVVELIKGGQSVVPGEALLAKQAGGLEITDATQEVVAVQGERFVKAVRFTIRKASEASNTTQLNLENTTVIKKGDALIATFWVRGNKMDGKSPAQLAFLFEKSSPPWTHSIFRPIHVAREGKTWKCVRTVFAAVEDYAAGEAMVSLRLAYGPQTVEIADFSVINLGQGKSAEEICRLNAVANPLPEAVVQVNFKEHRQTIDGFGGNFCQARYGKTDKIDPVGQYNLDHLNGVMARVGFPLNYYTPEPGIYKKDRQAKAAFELMQELARRQIPMIASVWEGPLWMLPGKIEEGGRVLAPERYDDCIAALIHFLVTARDDYHAPVDFFSFNEPDLGVNFKFTPSEMATFIGQAGPRFKAAGLTTKFLVGDTAYGVNLVDYATPLLADTTLAPYLGPLAFHCWDAMGASESGYRALADLGQMYHRPILCTEVGHDAQLYQQPNPWPSWENALRLVAVYARTFRLTGASVMLYWTYQNNYPLVTPNGQQPYPAFEVIQMLEKAFPKGSVVCSSAYECEGLQVLAARGPEGKGETVLLVNTVGAGTVTVKGLPQGKKVHCQTLKAAAEPQAAASVTGRNDAVVIRLPARSVTLLTME